MKNQRGVTLIALVVTIIVLIILAGVAIASLTGDNGLISRSREAKKLQIEAEVKDYVTLAVAAAKARAESLASTTAAGFLASTDVGNAKGSGETDASKIIAEMKATLSSDFTISDATTGDRARAANKVIITFTNSAYKQACNNSNAEIVVTVGVTGNNFTIPVWPAEDAGEETSGSEATWLYYNLQK